MLSTSQKLGLRFAHALECQLLGLGLFCIQICTLSDLLQFVFQTNAVNDEKNKLRAHGKVFINFY